MKKVGMILCDDLGLDMECCKKDVLLKGFNTYIFFLRKQYLET